jgi:1,4-alpha-glucan branching enzyme
VSPYDAELFGHWWFEGPQFIDFLFRKIQYDQQVLEPLTPYEYLERHPRNQVATPSFSSWGYKGYSEYWLEGSNDWIYRHLEHAASNMVDLASAHAQSNGIMERTLNQAARELLLAQSSDWAFIMKTGTTVPYAVRRTNEHLRRFSELEGMNRSGQVNEGRLREFESRDNLFPAIDFRAYCAT